MASRPGALAEAVQLRSQAQRGILNSGLCQVILIAITTPVWSSHWLTVVRIVGMIGLGFWCTVSLVRYQAYNRQVITIETAALLRVLHDARSSRYNVERVDKALDAHLLR